MNTRHAVKIGVVAREIGKTVGLHHGNDQGVVGQETGLPVNRRGVAQERRGDRPRRGVVADGA